MDDIIARLKPNVIASGLYLPEPVEILVVVPLGTSVKLIGSGLHTGLLQEPVLSAEQIAALTITPADAPLRKRWLQWRTSSLRS